MEGHKGEALSLYEGRISIKEFLALVAAYFSSLSVAPQEFLGEAEKALRGKLARAHKRRLMGQYRIKIKPRPWKQA